MLPLSAIFRFGPLFFFGAMAVGVGAVWALVIWARKREQRRWPEGSSRALSGKNPSLPYPITVRFGADGFWLLGEMIPAGSLIAYVYVTEGRVKSGDVSYVARASGHFVYTGSTPSQVEVIRISPPHMSDAETDDEFIVTTDETDNATPVAAWYAVQHPPPRDPPVERADPPAY